MTPPLRFRFAIGLLAKLIVVCAILAALLRFDNGTLVATVGPCVANSIIGSLKKGEPGVTGSMMPGLLIFFGIT